MAGMGHALNLKQHLQRCVMSTFYNGLVVEKAIVQKLLHPRNLSTKHLLPICKTGKTIIQLLVIVMFDGD